LKDAVQSISEILKEKNEWHLVVIKSTVIPLTCDNVVKPILDSMEKPYGLCMNPEFLTEISTSWTDDTKFKRDFWCKERIVIGEKDKKSGDMLASVYQPLNAPIFRVDLKTAEMTKYATNMMLATKISYWNEIFLVCKELNIDSKQVADITALDERIGRYGTIHGLAYGGSCLIKDIKAFTHAFCTEEIDGTKEYLRYPSVLNEVDAVNDFMEENYGKRE
jgi:UDPglucose 6-dehydrogenase